MIKGPAGSLLAFGTEDLCWLLADEAIALYRTFVGNVHQVGLVGVCFMDDIIGYFECLEFFNIFNFEVTDHRRIFCLMGQVPDIRRFAVNFYCEVLLQVIAHQLVRRQPIFRLEDIKRFLTHLFLN